VARQVVGTMVDIARFRAKAVSYRALARTTTDPIIHRELLFLAEYYEDMAVEAERPQPPRPAAAALRA
jgi:hypothetical protein